LSSSILSIKLKQYIRKTIINLNFKTKFKFYFSSLTIKKRMNEIEKIALLDPRVKVGEAVFKVVTSGLTVQPTQIPADQQGALSAGGYTNTILFNSVIIPNSQQTCVSRSPRIKYTVQVSTQAVAYCNSQNEPAVILPTKLNSFNNSNNTYANGTANNSAVNCCFRARPLMSVCQAGNITINSAVTATQPRYLLTAMQRYLPVELTKHQKAPLMNDNLGLLAIEKSWIGGTAAGSVAFNISPNSGGPLNSYANSCGLSRASLVASSVVYGTANAGQVDVYTFHFEEDLYPISPFSPGYLDANFLYNVFNLSINLNFASFQDMLYDGSGVALATSGLTVRVADAQLETTFITIDPNLVKIPPVCIYDYSLPTLYVRSADNVATNSYGTVQSDSLRLNSCPKRIWCFVQPNINNRVSQATLTGAPATDSALSLAQVSATGFDDTSLGAVQITYGTQTFLVGATIKELYDISARNGYNSTYEDFLLGSGSILCFDPMKDFGFNAGTDVAQGENGTVTFRIQMNVSWANYLNAGMYATPVAAIPIQMVVIAEYAGQLALSNNQQGLFSLGVIGPRDVNEMFSKPLPSVDMLPEGLKSEGAGYGKHIVNHMKGSSSGAKSSKSVLSKK